jgi:hypothetical protein
MQSPPRGEIPNPKSRFVSAEASANRAAVSGVGERFSRRDQIRKRSHKLARPDHVDSAHRCTSDDCTIAVARWPEISRSRCSPCLNAMAAPVVLSRPSMALPASEMSDVRGVPAWRCAGAGVGGGTSAAARTRLGAGTSDVCVESVREWRRNFVRAGRDPAGGRDVAAPEAIQRLLNDAENARASVAVVGTWERGRAEGSSAAGPMRRRSAMNGVGPASTRRTRTVGMIQYPGKGAAPRFDPRPVPRPPFGQFACRCPGLPQEWHSF